MVTILFPVLVVVVFTVRMTSLEGDFLTCISVMLLLASLAFPFLPIEFIFFSSSTVPEASSEVAKNCSGSLFFSSLFFLSASSLSFFSYSLFLSASFFPHANAPPLALEVPHLLRLPPLLSPNPSPAVSRTGMSSQVASSPGRGWRFVPACLAI